MIQGIKAVLLDLDGTVYVGSKLIEGAAEAIARLRESGLQLRFLTNTTTKSLASLHEKMLGMKLDVKAEEIISPTRAALIYLRQRGLPPCHLLLTDDPKKDFVEFDQPESKPEYVIVGDMGKSWDYRMMNDAFNMLIDGATLLALHKGRYWQTEEGLRMDIGAFVTGLEYSSGKEAVVLGKPSPTFFQMALSDLGCKADETLMVGDDLISDIGGAQAVGIQTALVKTGKYREELVDGKDIKPDIVLDSVAAVPHHL